MANHRIERVNEQILKETAEIIRTVKDPRVSGAFVSVTRADCTADLKYCKIYYSVMGEHRDGDCGKGLAQAAGYIRSCLAKRMNLRITPELSFVNDESLRRGAHISELLSQIEKELDAADVGGDDDG
ncbi:MAG: 30S ribosome-binding factor RbfA [Clostridia bacterium]|nr:30S ribosome-binding factor RbfA [Clostridia bacterium]